MRLWYTMETIIVLAISPLLYKILVNSHKNQSGGMPQDPMIEKKSDSLYTGHLVLDNGKQIYFGLERIDNDADLQRWKNYKTSTYDIIKDDDNFFRRLIKKIRYDDNIDYNQLSKETGLDENEIKKISLIMKDKYTQKIDNFMFQ